MRLAYDLFCNAGRVMLGSTPTVVFPRSRPCGSSYGGPSGNVSSGLTALNANQLRDLAV